MGSADPTSLCADSDVLAAAVTRLLDPLVGRIDRDGHYPGEALRELGALGAYRHHLATQRADGRRDVGAAIDAMTAIGRSCGSSAFMAWCQNACAWAM